MRDRKMKSANRKTESGNVFIFILLGVVLFAALSFTVARGMRGDTVSTMSEREAVLAASDILNYAQKLERAVNRIRSRGVSESDISFENTGVAGYTNANCTDNACRIFASSGGAASWKSPPSGANDGSDWVMTGQSCIEDLGTGAAGCGSDGNGSNEELLAILPNVATNLCTAINDRLGISGIPADGGGGVSSTKFTGSFADGTEVSLPGGPHDAACFSFGGNNYFYAVLLAR